VHYARNWSAAGHPSTSAAAMPRAHPRRKVVTVSPDVSLDDGFLFRSLMETMVDSIYFKDRQCRLVRVNRKMALDLGRADPAELIGRTDIELFGREFGEMTMLDDARIMETDEPIIGLTESRQLESGQVNWTLTTKTPLHDLSGTVVGLLGITREINELKRAEMTLEHLATHDTLTGLPNRYLMFDRLNQLLVRAARYGLSFAILFIDLDGFKRINDSRGHDVGDLVLRGVAERLTRNLRAADTVARIGGDEFVVLLESLRAGPDAIALADKIRSAVGMPFALPGGDAAVTVSIGIGQYPDDGRDAEELLKAADVAMYRAKRRRAAAAPPGPRRRPGSGSR
jgi:diguanylate cyclase (GGDEF)-like protein/PAS domain S-box-containing protein